MKRFREPKRGIYNDGVIGNASMKSVMNKLPLKPTPTVLDTRGWLRQLKGGDVSLEKDNNSGIATIRLEQPHKKNAVTGYMMVALEEAVARLESWEVGKGLLVYGAERNFCSGGDLDTVRQIADPTSGARMSQFMQNTLLRLQMLPLVSVAVLEGAGALGGGAEIAMACDWRLLAPGCAGIGFVHKRMGIAAAWGGATWLTRTIGYRRALDLMTTGRVVSGQEAIVLGVVDALLSSEDPLSEAVDWLNKRIEGPPDVVRAIKLMAINSSYHQQLDTILEEERKLFSPLWGGPANLKALDSNIKHRP